MATPVYSHPIPFGSEGVACEPLRGKEGRHSNVQIWFPCSRNELETLVSTFHLFFIFDKKKIFCWTQKTFEMKTNVFSSIKKNFENRNDLKSLEISSFEI